VSNIKEWNKPKQNVPMKERIGTVSINTYGSRMVVDEYNSFSDVWVKFINSDYRTRTTWQRFIEGMVKNPYDLRVYGIGYIGEGKYKVSENKKLTPIYKIWSSMIQRCYDDKFIKKHPSYKGSKVSEEWLCFQNFAAWYDQNYYEVSSHKMHLDKDILIKGNKTYSPETCVFVPQSINKLFTKTDAKRGKYPIGVTWDISNKCNPFKVQCNDGTGKQIRLGHYDSQEKAFLVYKKFKEKIIKQLAEDYKEMIPVLLYDALIKYEVEIAD
jgi:hypothetical protein